MIFVNPTFDQLQQLAQCDYLRGVHRGDKVALGDGNVHLHSTLAWHLAPNNESYYLDEEAFYVQRRGGQVTVDPAYTRFTSFSPEVDTIVNDLKQLMDARA